MNDPAARLVEARLREREARERFLASAESLKRRVSLDHLKRDASIQGRRARNSAFKAVRQNPVFTSGIIASLLLVVTRKPIARWLSGTSSRTKPYPAPRTTHSNSFED